MKPPKGEFARTMLFIRSRIWPFSIGMIGNCFIYASVAVAESYLMKYVIDASVRRNRSLLMTGIMFITAASFALLFFAPIFGYMYTSNGKSGHADIRKTVFRHRGKLPVSYTEKNHSGSLVARLLYDTSVMSHLYTARLRRLVFPFIYGTACVIPMFLLDWKITCILIVVNSISLSINTLYSKPIRRISTKIQASFGVMTEKLLNLLAGMQEIKLFHIKDIAIKHYEESNSENIKHAIRRNHLSSSLDSTNYLLGMASNLGLLFVGSYMVLMHITTFGTLFAIINLQRRLSQAFLDVGAYIPQVHDSLAGAARVFEYLDEPVEPEKYDMPDAPQDCGYIEMKNVSFEYGNGKTVLNGFDLSAKKGQTVALVGPSGCGKSTIIKLFLGFYPIKCGTISIAGKSLGQHSLRQLRDLIAYVPQDAYIFNGTIEENIRYGKPDATSEQIIEAAKTANAHNFITEQIDGYNTIVGERGGKLSGGQKQRIAIARAVLKNAPVLLLDEATSALDSESELLVKSALDNLMKNKTVIVVAHRFSTIENADLICVVDNGQLVEQGNHSELYEAGGLYRMLYDKQFNSDFEAAACAPD